MNQGFAPERNAPQIEQIAQPQTRRNVARNLAIAVAAIALIGALWIVGFGGDNDSAERSETVIDLDEPESSLTRFVGDPGAGGAATEVIVSETPPAEADTLCGTASAGGGPACRITATLVREPPAPPRAPKNKAGGNGPTLRPIGGQRPSSLGQYALVDAADPTVLVDGQTYYFFTTSARFMRVPVVAVGAERLVPNGSSGFSIQSPVPKDVGVEPGLIDLPSAGLSSSDPSAAVAPPVVAEPELTTDPSAVTQSEAMPERPPWARQDDIWAPTVARFGSQYVMFFAAKRPNPPDPANEECVGRAVSSDPAGPYVADPTPVTCGLGGIHGALDPSVFRDRKTGRAFLHVAFGGTSTPLWTIPLTGDGHAAGAAVPLLKMQQRWETWFLENPSMIFNGVDYTLAYSAGRWSLGSYSTGVARCQTPAGPCVSSPSGPWLSTSGNVSGPGGLDFFTAIDGALMAVHHGYETGRESAFGARHTFIRRAHADADVLSFP